VVTANVAYNLGHSYSFSGVAMGLSLKGAYRHVPSDIAAGQSILGVMIDGGLQTSWSMLKAQRWSLPNWSFGVAVKNLGLSTMSDESLPLTASAGLAYSPIRALTVATDFNLPLSLDAAPAWAYFDWAVGVDVAVAEFLSVRGGFTGHPTPDEPRGDVGRTIINSAPGLRQHGHW
jgi:hypothetical protein